MNNDQHGNRNPYSSPLPDQPSITHPHGPRHYVRQVKPLCICMIIQGALEFVWGLAYVGLGVAVPMFLANQPAGANIPEEQLEMVQMIQGLVLGGAGVLSVLTGALRVAAGWRGLYFRSRGLAMFSHFFGLLNVVTCYCLPTSIGLCIWGCMVHLKPEVKNAFKLGADGWSAAEIESGNIDSGDTPKKHGPI